MTLYYTIISFIFGITLGSFYNVVGYRLPRNESIVKPPSHCPNCNHRLRAIELVPIFSYIFLKGKCKNCKKKISLFYPLFELTTGILFALAYIVFGGTVNLAIALILISVLLIIMISDYQTMIIPDEVLIVGAISLAIALFIKGGLNLLLFSLINGIVAFTIMFLIKKLGDFMFKKESMGGGDIKLMFLFGMVFGYEMCLVIIAMASFIGLPISIFLLFLPKKRKYKDVPINSIPFGPFLAIAALIVLFLKININAVINFIA